SVESGLRISWASPPASWEISAYWARRRRSWSVVRCPLSVVSGVPRRRSSPGSARAGSGERPGAEGSAATSVEASELALDMVLLSAIELPCPRPWGLGSRALFEWLIFPDASAARLRTTDNRPDRSGPRQAAR